MNRFQKQRKRHGRDKRKILRPFHKRRRGSMGKAGELKQKPKRIKL